MATPVAEAAPKDFRSTLCIKWEMCHGIMRDPKLLSSYFNGLLSIYPEWLL